MNGPLDDRGLPAGYQFRPEYEMTPRDAAAQLARNPDSLLLVDCRTQPEWDFVHIPGSVWIPLSEIEKRADELEPKPGQVVAVICHHGVRSLRASLALRQLGHPAAMSVAGGIEAWALGADTTMARYERDGARCRAV